MKKPSRIHGTTRAEVRRKLAAQSAPSEHELAAWMDRTQLPPGIDRTLVRAESHPVIAQFEQLDDDRWRAFFVEGPDYMLGISGEGATVDEAEANMQAAVIAMLAANAETVRRAHEGLDR
jgi:hypothetical protein